MNTNCKNPRFSLFEEIDRGLNHFVREVMNPDGNENASPSLSIYEIDDAYVVQCDVPGVELEDIDIQLENGVLEISGERKTTIPDGASVSLNEVNFAKFSRKLQLSKDINPDGIDAALGSGVLRVSVPKSPATIARKVAVRRIDDSN